MATTIVTISNGAAQPQTQSGKGLVLQEPGLEEVLALRAQQPEFPITAIFRGHSPSPTRIRELFQAGVSQIDVCLKE